VKSIDYSGEEGVQLSFADGQTEDYDRVIVTAPLGVLKSRDIWFVPQLPKKVEQAIDGLGSGVLDKLILRFDEVFWNKECDWFNFISENPYEWT
jgi:monoamine oxidase